jgi:hypothetical protein
VTKKERIKQSAARRDAIHAHLLEHGPATAQAVFEALQRTGLVDTLAQVVGTMSQDPRIGSLPHGPKRLAVYHVRGRK